MADVSGRRPGANRLSQLVRKLVPTLHALRSNLPVSQLVKRSLADAQQRDVPAGEAADALAQAIVCGSAIAASFPLDWDACRPWLREQLAPWEQFVLERIAADGQALAVPFAELTHLYEHLLRHDQPDRRKRGGVFFTPQPIVRYMLRQIDESLRDEFSLPLGLADETTWERLPARKSLQLPLGSVGSEPFVRLFDPAAGTGAFLLQAIEFLHARLTTAWREEGLDGAALVERWNDYVPRALLPRLWGMELLAAPCWLAKLHVALALAQTGYRFREPGRIEIHLGNTLAGPGWGASGGRQPPGNAASTGGLAPPAHRQAAYELPFTVLLGNPPFSYLSENQGDWITALVRGASGHAGYLRADGQKLGEKKTWLHDDYVKFLRYAQWRIETTGVGIAALVTNHGYLTNATFRIMRQELLRAFPRIAVVDLHGNRKAREVGPDGGPDENVFGLDQGIAIGIFRRPPGEIAAEVQHAELWGTRAAKFERLNGGQVFNRSSAERGKSENLSCVPAAPEFRFVPREIEIPAEYAAAHSLTELFPLHATAPVTARDHFVVAFTRQELRQRMEAFRDLSLPDDDIRRRYFTRTRSPRYSPGDTRSWKLSAARRTLAALDDWEAYFRPCQYRPLDWRWIFWHPAMIDWPRHEVSHQFRAECRGQSARCLPASTLHSLALLARRQLPPTEPATYVWASTALTLDGVIRNDNRGSESLFPVHGDAIEQACYAYALLHSPHYRQRYAAALRTGFPRVLQARDRELAAALASLGRQLVELHTQRPANFDGPAPPMARNGVGPCAVAPRFPQYDRGRIWIGDDCSIADADEATWQFRVGAHQVARKWLADRRGRPLSADDVAWYGVILDVLVRTRELADRIDAAIAQQGGFPAAFA